MSEQPGSEVAPPVGVVLVGHGRTASELLAAAQGIVTAEAMTGVVAVDAGEGETPRLGKELCDVIERVDAGAGVLVVVDLLGASPCNCVQREVQSRRTVTLSGLNLAMLLKLAALDRCTSVDELAQACADSGRRAVQVQVPPPSGGTSNEERA